jgi:hypothetical protein
MNSKSDEFGSRCFELVERLYWKLGREVGSEFGQVCREVYWPVMRQVMSSAAGIRVQVLKERIMEANREYTKRRP